MIYGIKIKLEQEDIVAYSDQHKEVVLPKMGLGVVGEGSSRSIETQEIVFEQCKVRVFNSVTCSQETKSFFVQRKDLDTFKLLLQITNESVQKRIDDKTASLEDDLIASYRELNTRIERAVYRAEDRTSEAERRAFSKMSWWKRLFYKLPTNN